MVAFTKPGPIKIDHFAEDEKKAFDGDAVMKILKSGEGVSTGSDEFGNYEAFEIEYTVTKPSLFNGAFVLLKNQSEKDWCQFELLVPNPHDGQYFVYRQYVRKWFFDDSVQEQPVPRLPYGAPLPALVKLRVRYFKYGNEDILFKQNYELHEIVAE
jgi:hypothetical protein